MMRAGDEWRGGSISVALALVMALWSVLQVAPAEARRIALVIGNGDYTRFGDLRNPANDARAMAEKLRSLNPPFTLVGGQAHVDVSYRRMATLLRDLGDALERAPEAQTTALVYYSGHGVAEGGENWLVPVDDDDIRFREDVPDFTIGTDAVMRRLESSGGRLNILVLDACRNNPLESRHRTKGALTKGLVRVSDVSAETVMVYAAAPGKVAYDGPSGGLSPFTEALIEEMDEPGRRLADVLRRTAFRVKEKTEGEPEGPQVPWMNMSLLAKPFYFVPCPPGSDCPEVTISPPPVATWEDFEQKTECTDCPLMVAVPSGKFKMGGNLYSSELPIRSVNIGRLAVGVHEVTFSQWDACARAGGCSRKPGDNGWGRGNRPVIDVSWNDAQEYVRWLSKKTGQRYRLLSEAEWEYVARAGTTGPFHTGSTISRSQANYQGSETVEVGSYPESNRFGLHDVHGNVWEWVADCWHGDYSGAPQDGSAWTRDGDCGKRVFRGGSWENEKPEYVRSAYRWGGDNRLRVTSVGFRVARTLD